MEEVTDTNGYTGYTLGDQASSAVDIVGGVGELFTGDVQNPADVTTGGWYIFQVQAWAAIGEGPPV